MILLGTANQLRLAALINLVKVAGVTLPVASTLKSLGVILDQQRTFDGHAAAVPKFCNYHTRAIKHVPHFLPESVARTLACSLINSRLDYCNSLLHRAPESTLKKPHRSQNTAARVILAANCRSDAKPLLRQLHWLPVCQRVLYKMAALTWKTRMSGVLTYLSEHLVPHVAIRSTRSASLPLLTVPKLITDFSRHSFFLFCIYYLK